MMLPGEAEAIETVKRLGAQYGYGNLIFHLKNAWSEHLQAGGMGREAADLGAGHVCAWCETDSRTGQRAEAAGSRYE